MAMTLGIRRIGRALLTIVAAALVGAGTAAGQSVPAWGTAPRWLTCMDHPAGYLNALVTAAGQQPASILAFLDSAVQRGPGPATVRDYEQSLQRIRGRVAQLLSSRKGYTVRPESAFVTDYVRRLEVTWRVRAALGLGRVAYVYRAPLSPIGPQATAILQRLGHTLARSPVLTAVQQAQNTAYVRDSLPH